jgi:hypothetical protein
MIKINNCSIKYILFFSALFCCNTLFANSDNAVLDTTIIVENYLKYDPKISEKENKDSAVKLTILNGIENTFGRVYATTNDINLKSVQNGSFVETKTAFSNKSKSLVQGKVDKILNLEYFIKPEEETFIDINGKKNKRTVQYNVVKIQIIISKIEQPIIFDENYERLNNQIDSLSSFVSSVAQDLKKQSGKIEKVSIDVSNLNNKFNDLLLKVDRFKKLEVKSLKTNIENSIELIRTKDYESALQNIIPVRKYLQYSDIDKLLLYYTTVGTIFNLAGDDNTAEIFADSVLFMYPYSTFGNLLKLKTLAKQKKGNELSERIIFIFDNYYKFGNPYYFNPRKLLSNSGIIIPAYKEKLPLILPISANARFIFQDGFILQYADLPDLSPALCYNIVPSFIFFYQYLPQFFGDFEDMDQTLEHELYLFHAIESNFDKYFGNKKYKYATMGLEWEISGYFSTVEDSIEKLYITQEWHDSKILDPMWSNYKNKYGNLNFSLELNINQFKPDLYHEIKLAYSNALQNLYLRKKDLVLNKIYTESVTKQLELFKNFNGNAGYFARIEVQPDKWVKTLVNIQKEAVEADCINSLIFLKEDKQLISKKINAIFGNNIDWEYKPSPATGKISVLISDNWSYLIERNIISKTQLLELVPYLNATPKKIIDNL